MNEDRVNEDLDLTDSLRRLAAVLPREAGAAVEERLCSAVRARRSRKMPLWAALGAAAALLSVLVAVRFLWIDKRSPAVVYAYQAPGFTALPYAESGVPLETVVVVRVRLRTSELSSLGVAMPGAVTTAPVMADLLVGQDGVARAVRLVQ